MFTGENKQVRMWDLRAELEHPVLEYKVEDNGRDPNAEEQKNETIFTQIKDGVSHATSTTLRFQPSLNMLVCNYDDFPGITTYDIRKPGEPLNYYEYKSYPIAAFDTGSGFCEQVAMSCSSNELNVTDITKSKEEQKSAVIMQPHSLITNIKFVKMLMLYCL